MTARTDLPADLGERTIRLALRPAIAGIKPGGATVVLLGCLAFCLGWPLYADPRLKFAALLSAACVVLLVGGLLHAWLTLRVVRGLKEFELVAEQEGELRVPQVQWLKAQVRRFPLEKCNGGPTPAGFLVTCAGEQV